MYKIIYNESISDRFHGLYVGLWRWIHVIYSVVCVRVFFFFLKKVE